jgi:hypothetical protein
MNRPYPHPLFHFIFHPEDFSPKDLLFKFCEITNFLPKGIPFNIIFSKYKDEVSKFILESKDCVVQELLVHNEFLRVKLERFV